MSNLRALFVGASPWNNSGYGKPMRYLVPRIIRAGYECAIVPFYGYDGPPIDTDVGGEQVTILPRARDPYLGDIIHHHVRRWKADVVISLCDVWILDGWGQKGFPWLPRFPVDTHPIPPQTLEAIQGCHTPLALTRWGQQELIDAGWPTAHYIPHGVDLDIYRPMDKARCRRKLGLPEGAYIAGMVAANSSEPSRKSFPEVMRAWKRWLDWGGDGHLYLHTTIMPRNRSDVGLDLLRVADSLGLKAKTMDASAESNPADYDVLFPSQYEVWTNAVSDEKLAKAYNSFDVLLSPSKAEGFGIPLIEAQACGVPVITNEVTSMPELTFAGKCLPSAQHSWCVRREGAKDGGWRGVADIEALADAIHWAYAASQIRPEEMAEKARAGVMQFGWDRLVERHWLPLLKELEEWL